MSCSKLLLVRPRLASAATTATAATVRRTATTRMSATAMHADQARRLTTVVRHLASGPVSRALHARSFSTARAAQAESTPAVKQYPPPAQLAKDAAVKSMAQYQQMYERSLHDSDAFWREQAEGITWDKQFTQVQSGEHAYDTEWFKGGKLNASVNCVDRHVATRGNKAAIVWEADNKEVRTLTYSELHAQVQRAANVLKSLGVKKGMFVTLYAPMVPETVVAMLACARLGCPHNVVFAGFSEDALRDRINYTKSSVVITSDQMVRGGKHINLKDTVDAAIKSCPSIKHVLVINRTGTGATMTPGRDVAWNQAMAAADPVCAPVSMDSDDPLFCLFTSGSTGKPKGLVHTTGGYLTYAASTTKYAFDVKDSDIYACTADVGWITGHTYIVYGPLALGATTFLFEGHPQYPDEGRFWDMVQRHKISIFYTSPTAIRSLMRFGDDPVKRYDRSSLRILGSVGEPINPEAWEWLYHSVGNSTSPIIDTYWQTESGGILLSPLPGATTLKPGSATFPFFGIEPALVDPVSHVELPAKAGQEATGALVIKRAWPGLARTILDNPERYRAAYFNSHVHAQAYVTGDSARRDADGYYWIIGRMDDVVNVSGHRIGSAEVEGAMTAHSSAAEAAVVGFPHPIKGEALFAFVTLKAGIVADEKLVKEIKAVVQRDIGKLAIPDHILIAEALPKTRSGKIMRRLLRQLVMLKTDAASLGDTSTLLDPSVVDVLKVQVANLLKNASSK